MFETTSFAGELYSLFQLFSETSLPIDPDPYLTALLHDLPGYIPKKQYDVFTFLNYIMGNSLLLDNARFDIRLLPVETNVMNNVTSLLLATNDSLTPVSSSLLIMRLNIFGSGSKIRNLGMEIDEEIQFF